jgi:hypothetical protein
MTHFIDNACKDAGVSRDVFYTTCYIESRGKKDAVSSAGAQGLFQIKPAYAGDYGVGGENLFNPSVNAKGAVTGFVKNFNRFKTDFGREPLPNELYGMWNQGYSGFTKIVDAAQNGTTLSNTIKNNMRGNSNPSTDDPETFLEQWRDKWVNSRSIAITEP